MSPLTLAFWVMRYMRFWSESRLFHQAVHLLTRFIKCLSIKCVRRLSLKQSIHCFTILTEEEAEILKRGRNANSAKVPKSSTANDYRKATGLESLFGYLYLNGKIKRINEIFSYIYQINENDILKDDK